MPHLTLPSRREFITSAAVGAPLAAARTETRWALLSDTHISVDPANEYRGFRPQANLRQTVGQVIAAAPDGVLIGGDLARLEGLPGDYGTLRGLLAPLSRRVPVGMALGNHDNRANFLAAFDVHPGERQAVTDKHVLVIDAAPVRFIVLDSLVLPNFTPGQLGKVQRDWLNGYLKSAAAVPTVLLVHHTLDDLDTALLDALWLLKLAVPHRTVKAILYGHSHAFKFDVHEGIHLVNVPAVGYNFSGAHPVGWLEARFTAEGADFKLRAIGGNTARDGQTTSIAWR